MTPITESPFVPVPPSQASAHERHRAFLYALSEDSCVVPIVDAGGAERGWWTPNRKWKREYTRFHPDRQIFADLVFISDRTPQAVCRVELSSGPLTALPADGFEVKTGSGFARFTRFPADPLLPGLRAVAAQGGVVMRYHPSHLCTLRVETEDCGTVFAKVYANREKAELIHRDAVSLWRAVTSGGLGFRIAEPLRWDAATSTAWQRQLTGQPVSGRMGSADGDVFVARLGRAAASLTQVAVTLAQVTDGASQLERSTRIAEELVCRVPSLQLVVARTIARLGETHASIETRPLRPIHGSLRTDQCIVDGESIGIFDFDRSGSGDPEMDAGTFIHSLEFLRHPAHPFDRLRTCFLEGYEAIAGPLRRQLVTAYQVHARLGKALRAAQKVRPDGDARAAQLAQEAWQILTGSYI